AMADFREQQSSATGQNNTASSLAMLVASGDLPHDKQALTTLARILSAASDPERGGPDEATARALDEARRTFRDRGGVELVSQLYEAELGATTSRPRRADLLLEQGRLLFEELHDEPRAVAAFKDVLKLRPEDGTAQELLAHIGLVRENWERIVKKYLDEAKVSTDRQLTTGLYLSVAETYARYGGEAPYPGDPRNPAHPPDVQTYLPPAL